MGGVNKNELSKFYLYLHPVEEDSDVGFSRQPRTRESSQELWQEVQPKRGGFNSHLMSWLDPVRVNKNNQVLDRVLRAE